MKVSRMDEESESEKGKGKGRKLGFVKWREQ